MTQIKIEKGSVQETLMLPLFGRKLCAERFPSFYKDAWAAEICSRLDYDFSALEAKQNSSFWQFAALEAAVREKDMVWEIEDYLREHPKAAVVNMGCGLNQTGRTADNGSCLLYNLDFADVITLRESLLPLGAREVLLAVDLNDYSWMDKIPAENGVIFYAAGVFHYFKKEEVKRLTLELARRFPGSRLVFDAVGSFGLNVLMKKSLEKMDVHDVKSHFSVDKLEELEPWSDKLKFSRRSYMHGYHPFEDPNFKRLHRFLGSLCDSLVHMYIYRVDFPS